MTNISDTCNIDGAVEGWNAVSCLRQLATGVCYGIAQGCVMWRARIADPGGDGSTEMG